MAQSAKVKVRGFTNRRNVLIECKVSVKNNSKCFARGRYIGMVDPAILTKETHWSDRERCLVENQCFGLIRVKRRAVKAEPVM